MSDMSITRSISITQTDNRVVKANCDVRSEIEGSNVSITRSITVVQTDNRFLKANKK